MEDNVGEWLNNYLNVKVFPMLITIQTPTFVQTKADVHVDDVGKSLEQILLINFLQPISETSTLVWTKIDASLTTSGKVRLVMLWGKRYRLWGKR